MTLQEHSKGRKAVAVHTPAYPILWLEAVRELTGMAVRSRLKKLPGVSHSLFGEAIDPEESLSSFAHGSTSDDGTFSENSSLNSEPIAMDKPLVDWRKASLSVRSKPIPLSQLIASKDACTGATQDVPNLGRPTSVPISVLLAMLWHPISEVREGVILGCEEVLQTLDVSAVVLIDHGLLRFLMARIAEEKEPPLLQSVMRVLCMCVFQFFINTNPFWSIFNTELT